MDALLMWCGLAGAWLLVAGPVYQAALELREHELAVDRLEAARAIASKTPSVSRWWWLVPPAKIVLERRRTQAHRQIYMDALSVEQFESLVSFINKATGWLLVASGGFLLAAKETLQALRERQFGALASAAVVAGVTILCVLYTVWRMAMSERVLAEKTAQVAASKPASP